MNPDVPTPSPAITFIEPDFFAACGPLPVAYDDLRRFPRFYYRTQTQAIIHPLAGVQGASPQPCILLTRDLSRGGINVLHTEQLFPGQRIDLMLTGGVPRSVEVVWCRRLAPRCWSAGCRFIRPETAGDSANPAS